MKSSTFATQNTEQNEEYYYHVAVDLLHGVHGMH